MTFISLEDSWLEETLLAGWKRAFVRPCLNSTDWWPFSASVAEKDLSHGELNHLPATSMELKMPGKIW
jgi:hypothetical protein